MQQGADTCDGVRCGDVPAAQPRLQQHPPTFHQLQPHDVTPLPVHPSAWLALLPQPQSMSMFMPPPMLPANLVMLFHRALLQRYLQPSHATPSQTAADIAAAVEASRATPSAGLYRCMLAVS